MADVVVTTSAGGSINELDGMHGPYWTSTSVGYLVIGKNTNDVEVWKTDDSGATWAEQDAANEPTSANNRTFSAWYDRETPGNTGTLIHIAFVKTTNNEIRYVTFDTSDDTFGTIRTVDSLTISNTAENSDVAITCSKSGRVYVAARGDFAADTENTDHSMRSSSDGFATNNESELSPYSSDEEVVKLFPGADADEDDICAVVYDVINTDLEFWKFDASANTWGVTAIDATIDITGTEARLYKGLFDAAIRHSDDHILVVYFNNFHQAAGDFKSVDITQATPIITAKTDLHTNIDDSAFPSILINQQNDDVYVAYAGEDGGTETLLSQVQCYFKKSTDGMGIWGTEQSYGIEDDDLKKTSIGRTIGDAGGRIMPAFYDDDNFTIFVNDGNDVEIAGAVVAVTGALFGYSDPFINISYIA